MRKSKDTFSILAWNIAGIRKIEGLEYLNGFKVNTIQETWIEKEKEIEKIRKLDKQ